MSEKGQWGTAANGQRMHDPGEQLLLSSSYLWPQPQKVWDQYDKAFCHEKLYIQIIKF